MNNNNQYVRFNIIAPSFKMAYISLILISSSNNNVPGKI